MSDTPSDPSPPNSEDRKHLSFEEAEGAVPLPSQLKLNELNQALRAFIWAILYEHIKNAFAYSSMGGGPYLEQPWKSILRDKHVLRDHRMLDEFPDPEDLLFEIKNTISNGSYTEVLGMAQWILRHKSCPPALQGQINGALQRSRSAYRVVEKTIMPLASEAEAQAIKLVFANPSMREFNGARVHLGQAGEHLTQGEWASSVRESVHSVEAVVRLLEPGRKLDEALLRLEKSEKIHPALKKGFLSLYGFTSDQQGIRHPLLEKEAAEVDEYDALYMFGACASFVTYLIGKGGKAKFL